MVIRSIARWWWRRTHKPLFGALGHPAQTDPATFRLDRLNLDIDDVADAEEGAAWQPAAVEQPIVLDANIDKCAEVDNISDSALESQARLEVVQREYIAAQDRRGQIFARVAAGAQQLLDNVAQRWSARAKPSCQIIERLPLGQRLQRRLT